MTLDTRFWAGKRVLVTGHTGFKGAWLCHWLLRRGASVTGYSLAPPSEPSLFDTTNLVDAVAHEEGDVRDLDALRRCVRAADPEIVFHMAAQSLVLDSYLDPVGTFATNVMGTVNLLGALRSAPSLRACVIVTSDKCYENTGGRHAYREDDPLGGTDPYSASKGAAEIVTASLRRSFFTGGSARVVSVRAGNVVGGGDWARDRLVPDVVRAVTTATALELRHPEAVRPWQHVLEPLSGYTTLAERVVAEPHLEGAWNFGPIEETDWTVRDVAAAFVEAWGSSALEAIQVVPATLHEAAYLGLDSSKAQALLGWQPRWTIAETVERTVAWYRTFHDGGASATALVESDLDAYERSARAVPAGRARS
jgi:CDP-glucose 4,6-dehydratase